MARRSWGSGSLYQRGKTWWIAYRVNGKLYRESSETDVKQKAQNKLKDRLTALNAGMFDPDSRNTTVKDLFDLIKTDYKVNGKRVADVEKRLLHLGPYFNHLKASQVTFKTISRYIETRQNESAKNATINNELAALKRAFNLALIGGIVSRKPVFPTKLQENNIRTGFLEADQHTRLSNETATVGLWLRAIFETGYTFGWRFQEVVTLKVSQIDFQNRTVRLEPGTTKNKQGRTAVMTQPLLELLKACCEGKKNDDAVFTRKKGTRTERRKTHNVQVKTFVTDWKNCTKRAGVEGLLFHDLRRTAVRNMVRAGIPEGVAMRISGHKTRSVFERYNIVSERDIADAATKLEAFQSTSSQNVHNRPKADETGKTHTTVN